MYATEEETNELITFALYKTTAKADWGVWELYFALGYNEIPTLAAERLRSGGGGAPPTFDLILSMQRP